MASIYKQVSSDIDDTDIVFPHHIHSIYQVVSDKKEVREGPYQTDIENNETEFTGSLSVGGGRGENDEKKQVGEGSLSAVFGKENKAGRIDDNNNDKEAEKSFIFGEGLKNASVDNSLLISGDSGSSNLNYVRSYISHYGVSFTIPFEFSDVLEKEFVQFDLDIVAIDDVIDDMFYMAAYSFKGCCNLRKQELEKSKLLEKNEYRKDSSKIDITLDDDGVYVEDNRETLLPDSSPYDGRYINWTFHFSSSEIYR